MGAAPSLLGQPQRGWVGRGGRGSLSFPLAGAGGDVTSHLHGEFGLVRDAKCSCQLPAPPFLLCLCTGSTPRAPTAGKEAPGAFPSRGAQGQGGEKETPEGLVVGLGGTAVGLGALLWSWEAKRPGELHRGVNPGQLACGGSARFCRAAASVACPASAMRGPGAARWLWGAATPRPTLPQAGRRGAEGGASFWASPPSHTHTQAAPVLLPGQNYLHAFSSRTS